MYHCQIRFYLTGHSGRMFDVIKKMAPFEHFTHEFMESEKPEEALAADADVIFVDLRDCNPEEVLHTLLSGKRKDAELILLAEREHLRVLTKELPEIKDIWILPMSEDETAFRFLRWQQTCKMSRDFWQASQFLDAAINHTPNLVWFKQQFLCNGK